MDKMQKEIDCAALYFLASDGSCMTQDGEKSSLGSQTGLGTHLSDGEDVVVNAALPESRRCSCSSARRRKAPTAASTTMRSRSPTIMIQC